MTGNGVSSLVSQSTNAPVPLPESRSGKLEPSSEVLELGSSANVLRRPPLPQLPYSLRCRKLSITVVWAIMLLDAFLLPLVLFYVLKYGAKLDDARNLGITNAIFGFFSFFQYGVRLYRLLQRSPRYRPLDTTSRFALDFYQLQFTFGFLVITAIISVGTSASPLIRLLAMAPTALLVQCGPQFLMSCYATRRGWKMPFRFSSMPRGSVAVPAAFTIVEDVVAVDAGAGREFREKWRERYQVSEAFRDMLWTLTMAWGVGAIVAAVVAGAVVFTAPKYFAYGFGWSFPFAWAAGMAVWTTRWVQRKLKEEEEDWNRETSGNW